MSNANRDTPVCSVVCTYTVPMYIHVYMYICMYDRPPLYCHHVFTKYMYTVQCTYLTLEFMYIHVYVAKQASYIVVLYMLVCACAVYVC